MAKFLSFICLFSISIYLWAENEPIQGVILDIQSKKPLPFTSIGISGQFKGTVSNIEGEFALDLSNVGPNDTVLFSHVGYKTLKIQASKLKDVKEIYLQPASVNLKAFEVSSRNLSVKEILKLIKENYEENYPNESTKQKLFCHKYDKFPVSKTNQLIVKESDFVGLDKETLESLIQKMPDQFLSYQDALFNLYSHDEEHKLIPIEAISLEEGSQLELFEEFEDKLGDFFKDIENSMKNEDIYYKFRTGILSQKIENKDVNDSLMKEIKKDTLNFTIETKWVKDAIIDLYEDYTNIKSSQWEFINDPGKYKYFKTMSLINDELVYEISFKPKKSGMYQGTFYVSTSTYAVIQLDIEYAEGKESEKFQILGLGHAMKYRRAFVIFEKGNNGYYVKYLFAKQNEFASLNRSFSVMKKKKRFLFDKELNEIKMKARLDFNINSMYEILLLEREVIGASKFDQVQEPKSIKFRKEFAYTPEMWETGTVIVPTSELKKYERK